MFQIKFKFDFETVLKFIYLLSFKFDKNNNSKQK